MPVNLTVTEVIATISAQLNVAPKDVFRACLRDTRFKQRGVFHLNFTSPELLTRLLSQGFVVGGKTIGGGKIRCFVPNFGVVYDTADAFNALCHLGTVTDINLVQDAHGIRVGGLQFQIIPFKGVILDMLEIDGQSYDIRYPNKVNLCRRCHLAGHIASKCPNQPINCKIHGLTHVCPENLDATLISDSESLPATSVTAPPVHVTTPESPVTGAQASPVINPDQSQDETIHSLDISSSHPPLHENHVLLHIDDSDTTISQIHDALQESPAFEYTLIPDGEFQRSFSAGGAESKALCLHVHDDHLALLMGQLLAGLLGVEGRTYDRFSVVRHDVNQPPPEPIDAIAWGTEGSPRSSSAEVNMELDASKEDLSG